MDGAGRLNVVEAIWSLQAVDSDCSCDEDDDNTPQSVMQATFKNFDLSDSNSDNDSDPPDSRNDYGGQSSSNQWDTLSSRAVVRLTFDLVLAPPKLANLFHPPTVKATSC